MRTPPKAKVRWIIASEDQASKPAVDVVVKKREILLFAFRFGMISWAEIATCEWTKYEEQNRADQQIVDLLCLVWQKQSNDFAKYELMCAYLPRTTSSNHDKQEFINYFFISRDSRE